VNAYESPETMAKFLVQKFTGRERLRAYLEMAERVSVDPVQKTFWRDVHAAVDRLPE